MNRQTRILSFLQEHYSPQTTTPYYRHWQEFEQYLKLQQISLTKTTHPQLLAYIQHLQKGKISAQQINKQLKIIERIYAHLYPQKSNPVQGLRLQRGARSSLPEPLREAVLLEVLAHWKQENPRDQQNHLLLQLIHHQALRSSELNALKIQHLDLNKGLLQIPSCSRSASRELLLQAHQIALFQNHLTHIRPTLGGKRVGLDYLFSAGGKDAYLMNTLARLSRQTKAVFNEKGYILHNLAHWRSSRIVHFLERLPLLEVQTLVGHKYASSTERYQLQGVEQLSEALRWHHPLEQQTD